METINLPTIKELSTVVVSTKEEADYYMNLYNKGLIPFLPSDKPTNVIIDVNEEFMYDLHTTFNTLIVLHMASNGAVKDSLAKAISHVRAELNRYLMSP